MNTRRLYSAVDMGCYETRFVYAATNGQHRYPFKAWRFAATNIQEALEAAGDGCTVWIGDGVYAPGAPTVVGNAVFLVGFNGAAITSVDGAGTHRCLQLAHSAAVVSGLTLRNGRAANSAGGGALFTQPGGTLEDCVVENCAAEYGGGVFFSALGGRLERCSVRNNTALTPQQPGGGVYLRSGVALRNCLIAGNTGLNVGGGVLAYYGGAIENCTVTDNHGGNGGGICWYGTGCAVSNSIVYGNSGAAGVSNYAAQAGASVRMAFSCTAPDPGEMGNITDDPQYFDAGSANFHLLPTSPCLDRGADLAWMAGAGDRDGRARIYGAHVDMGCYEMAPTPVHYVSLYGGDQWPYDTWSLAARSIQTAVDTSEAGDAVRVGEGTYAVTAPVTLSKGISLLGEYGRDATLVDGGLVSRCFLLQHAAAVLDCFTATNGYAYDGGGLEIKATGGTFRNGLIAGCSAERGGGAFAAGGLVENCVLAGNTAAWGGGATLLGGALRKSSLCGNRASIVGGGAYVTGAVLLDDCEVSDNVASGPGGFVGGVACSYGALLRNCLICRNTAPSLGGVMCGSGGESMLLNCTIVGNSADWVGGVYCQNAGTLRNCVIWTNAPTNCEVWGDGWSIDHCCTTPDPGGEGNVAAAPLFMDAPGGNYRLAYGSPCIESGAYVPVITNDLDGFVRPSTAT